MLKYLVIQISDDSPSFCHYAVPCYKEPRTMALKELENALVFAMKENLSIQIVLPNVEISQEYWSLISEFDYIGIAGAHSHYADKAQVIVFNSVDEFNSCPIGTGVIAIIAIGSEDLCNIQKLDPEKLNSFERINFILKNVECLTDIELELYKSEIELLSELLEKAYREHCSTEINCLTDRVFLNKMNNCNAGIESISVLPNGKLYYCPAFYIDNPGNSIGTTTDGLNIHNSQLLNLNHSPICRICDAYQCKRCIWLNQKLTGELNTPSRQQCVLSHIDRNQSRLLLNKLREVAPKFNIDQDIKEIEYLDPFELISR